MSLLKSEINFSRLVKSLNIWFKTFLILWKHFSKCPLKCQIVFFSLDSSTLSNRYPFCKNLYIAISQKKSLSENTELFEFEECLRNVLLKKSIRQKKRKTVEEQSYRVLQLCQLVVLSMNSLILEIAISLESLESPELFELEKNYSKNLQKDFHKQKKNV